MDISIQSLGFDADKKLVEFVKSKAAKLSKISDDILMAEITLRLENTQTDENKIAELKLDIPKNNIFAKKQAKSFEEAFDSVVNAVKPQLKKRKGKIRGI